MFSRVLNRQVVSERHRRRGRSELLDLALAESAAEARDREEVRARGGTEHEVIQTATERANARAQTRFQADSNRPAGQARPIQTASVRWSRHHPQADDRSIFMTHCEAMVGGPATERLNDTQREDINVFIDNFRNLHMRAAEQAAQYLKCKYPSKRVTTCDDGDSDEEEEEDSDRTTGDRRAGAASAVPATTTATAAVTSTGGGSAPGKSPVNKDGKDQAGGGGGDALGLAFFDDAWFHDMYQLVMEVSDDVVRDMDESPGMPRCSMQKLTLAVNQATGSPPETGGRSLELWRMFYQFGGLDLLQDVLFNIPPGVGCMSAAQSKDSAFVLSNEDDPHSPLPPRIRLERVCCRMLMHLAIGHSDFAQRLTVSDTLIRKTFSLMRRREMFDNANELLCYLLLAHETLSLNVLKNGFNNVPKDFAATVGGLNPEQMTKFCHTLLSIYQNGTEAGTDASQLPPPDCEQWGETCVKCKNNETCCAAPWFLERMVALVHGLSPPWTVDSPMRLLNLDQMKQCTVVLSWDALQKRNRNGDPNAAPKLAPSPAKTFAEKVAQHIRRNGGDPRRLAQLMGDYDDDDDDDEEDGGGGGGGGGAPSAAVARSLLSLMTAMGMDTPDISSSSTSSSSTSGSGGRADGGANGPRRPCGRLVLCRKAYVPESVLKQAALLQSRIEGLTAADIMRDYPEFGGMHVSDNDDSNLPTIEADMTFCIMDLSVLTEVTWIPLRGAVLQIISCLLTGTTRNMVLRRLASLDFGTTLHNMFVALQWDTRSVEDALDDQDLQSHLYCHYSILHILSLFFSPANELGCNELFLRIPGVFADIDDEAEREALRRLRGLHCRERDVQRGEVLKDKPLLNALVRAKKATQQPRPEPPPKQQNAFGDGWDRLGPGQAVPPDSTDDRFPKCRHDLGECNCNAGANFNETMSDEFDDVLALGTVVDICGPPHYDSRLATVIKRNVKQTTSQASGGRGGGGGGAKELQPDVEVVSYDVMYDDGTIGRGVARCSASRHVVIAPFGSPRLQRLGDSPGTLILKVVDAFLMQTQKQKLCISLGSCLHKWLLFATVAEKGYVLQCRPQLIEVIVKRVMNHPADVLPRDAPAMLQQNLNILGAIVRGDSEQFLLLDEQVKALEGKDTWSARLRRAGSSSCDSRSAVAKNDGAAAAVEAIRSTRLAKVVATHIVEAHGFLASVALSKPLAQVLHLESGDHDAKEDGDSRNDISEDEFNKEHLPQVPPLRESLCFQYFFNSRYALFARLAVKIARSFTQPELSFDSLMDVAGLAVFAHVEFGKEFTASQPCSAKGKGDDSDDDFVSVSSTTSSSDEGESASESDCSVDQSGFVATFQIPDDPDNFRGAREFAKRFNEQLRAETAASSARLPTSEFAVDDGQETSLEDGNSDPSKGKDDVSKATGGGGGGGASKDSVSKEDATNDLAVVLPRLVKAVYVWREILENNGNLAEEFIFQVPRGRLLRVSAAFHTLLQEFLRQNNLKPSSSTMDDFAR